MNPTQPVEILAAVIATAGRRHSDHARRIEQLRVCDPELIALTRDVFDSDQGAASWLLMPTHALAGLNGAVPVDLLDTADGREAVRQLLRKIEYDIPL